MTTALSSEGQETQGRLTGILSHFTGKDTEARKG